MTAPTLAPASAQLIGTDPVGSGTVPDRRDRPRPVGVRRVPTPPLAPPYDDERAEGDGERRSTDWDGSHRWLAGDGGALAGQLPFPAPSAAVPRLRLAATPEPGTAAAGLAPPAAWSARFVRVLLEALAGLRPLTQLATWANPDVCRGISRRVSATDRCGDLPRAIGNLRSLHLSSPAAGVAEVCAVVRTGHRIRAIALRIEAAGGQWRCTSLTIG